MGTLATRRDVWAGILIFMLGCGSCAEGRHLRVGTLTSMGPGYFPVVLGILLGAVGLAIALVGVLSRDPQDGAEHAPPDWRGCIAIVLGMASFVVLGEHFGLAPATFSCVLISALGERTSTLVGSATLALAMTAVAIGLFSMALQINMPILKFG